MKNLIFIVLFAGFLFGAPAVDESLKFRIDTNHSNIGFAVPIAGGMSKVRGKFSEFEMDLSYDPKDITNSTVDVRIMAASVDTGIDQRDDHIRTDDFLNAEKFPEITFKSKEVLKESGKLVLLGDFTMRGITKEIKFPFEITGEKTEKVDDKLLMNVGFVGRLVIDRTDYDVNYQHQAVPNFVGNDIEIELYIMTRSKNIAKSAEKKGY